MKKLLLILLLSISYNLSAQVINPTTGKIWMENSLPGHYQWGHVSNYFTRMGRNA